MIGDRIRELRDLRGLTQSELAARLSARGRPISRTAIALWETDRSNPTTARLRDLADVLGVTVESLIPPSTTDEKADPMPFPIRDLSVLAYAQGFTLWHAKVASVRDVLKPDYFEDARDLIAKGDHIHVSAEDGGCILIVGVGTRVYQMASAEMPAIAMAA
jgi:transcriptional regulator with XRE-family HTH domain